MKIEIRAAEGGLHAKTIVRDLAKAYSKYLEGRDWKHSIEFADGSATVSCRDIPEFINEAGGHRWQEVSPTDKRGRVHTSTVTVAVVLDHGAREASVYDLREDHHFTYTLFSGTGAGGQHRNKHQNSVRMIHIPTGLVQKAEGRNRQNNVDEAKARLIAMLDQARYSADHHAVNDLRATQIGSGQRGDKIRTYRFQDDSITDHRTNKTTSCRRFMKGEIERLW